MTNDAAYIPVAKIALVRRTCYTLGMITKAEKNCLRVKKYQDVHRKKGLCVQCPNEAEPNRVRCSHCLEQRALIRRAARLRAINKGFCYQCHTTESLSGHKLCENCYFKGICLGHFKSLEHWQHLRNMYQFQKGKCALSGVAMTLGENVELDHIIPLSRGGENTPENTQWVLCVVNRMKDHLLEDEFFRLIESLHFTMSQKS